MLQMTFSDITHPEDLEADLEQMQAIVRGDNEPYTMEKRYVRKDGSQVWVNLTVSLVREASGEPRYFISVVEDISERKRIEEERDLLLVGEKLARAEADAARRRLALLAAAGPALSASPDHAEAPPRAPPAGGWRCWPPRGPPSLPPSTTRRRSGACRAWWSPSSRTGACST